MGVSHSAAQPLPRGPLVVKSSDNKSFLSCDDEGHIFLIADDASPTAKFMLEEDPNNSSLFRIRSLQNKKHLMQTKENWIDAAATHPDAGDLFEVITAGNSLRLRHVENDRFVDIAKDPQKGNIDRLSLDTTDLFKIFPH